MQHVPKADDPKDRVDLAVLAIVEYPNVLLQQQPCKHYHPMDTVDFDL